MFKKLEDRCRASQEEYARMLIRVAQSIFAALFLAVVTVPLGLLTNFYFKMYPNAPSIAELSGDLFDWLLPAFLFFTVAASFIAWSLARTGLNTLDKYSVSDEESEKRDRFKRAITD